MKRILLLLILGIGLGLTGWGQVNISVGTTVTQDFTIGTNATATMPTGWKVDKNSTARLVGTYSAAVSATEQRGGNSMSGTAANGIYNYAAGDPTTATDRAVGGLSSSTASKSVNTYLFISNNGVGSITSFTISYAVEKYRKGSNAAGYSIQMYYSTDGSSWTSAGSDFLTSFAADADNTGYTTAPGVTSNVSSKTLTVTIAASSSIYLAWNYSVTSGTSTGNAQALGIDDVSITANGTVISASSDIIANTSFTYPFNIAYDSYQGTSLTTGNSMEVAQFDIRDGGSTFDDADVLSTILTAISFNVANSSCLRRIALFEGSTNLSEVAGGATASFSSLTLEATDGNSKTFSIRVSFLSSVTDNQQFSFTVSSATASGSGSGFAAGNAGGAVSSTTGHNNRIEVAATDLIFDVDPTTVSINAVMSPSPTVVAIDGNLNTDLDFIGTVELSTTGTFSGTATISVAAISGTSTFSNLIFSEAGTAITITGACTPLTPTGNSSTFDVTNPLPEINIKQGVTNISSGGSYDFSTQLSGTNSSAISFTIENLGAATLNLNGTPNIVAISGTNASEFAINQSATSSTVAVSDNTSFTITFNPTSQGAKTAAISIANNDTNENPYIINLTGTGTVTALSDIIAHASFTAPTDIDYSVYQAADITGGSNDVEVAKFTLRDGGASSPDNDNLGTTLTALSLSLSNSANIRRVALYVDGIEAGTEQAGAASLTFSGLNITAADNGSKDISVRVSFNTSVTDNQQFQFTITSATASSTGSGFAVANAGGASSSITGNDNKIEVTVAALVFGVNPSNVTINAVMSPSPTVLAKDANANADLDFEGLVTLSSTGTISGSATNPVTASGGTATFSNLIFSAVGTGITIAGSLGSLTPTGNSSTFNVTVQAAGLLLFEENFSYVSGTNLTANGWTAHSVGGTNPIKVHTSGLSYANYGSSTIGNSAIINASGEDDNRTFAQQNSGSTTYCAFLVDVSSATSAGDYIVHLGPSTISIEFRGRFYSKFASGNLTFGVSTNGTVVNYAATNYSYNTTYLIVLKHFFNGTTQTTSLYINPSVTSEPSVPNATETSTTNLSTNIGSVAIRQSSASNVAIIDGIRVGTNWGAVLGNPQYDAVSSIAAGNYNNVTTYSGSAVSQTGNVIVNGTLTLTGGTFSPGANTLTLSGPYISGSLDNLTTTSSSSLVLNCTGTGPFTLPAFTAINNLTLNSSGQNYNLNSNPTISGILNISTGSLTIPSSNNLNVTGTLTNSASTSGLVIKSDATGTGSLKHTTANVDATFQRYMNNADWTTWKDGWHLLSSPVAAQAISPNFTVEPVATGAYDFYCWYEPENLWVNYKNLSGGSGTAPYFDVVNGSTNFIVGKGYMAAYDETATNLFIGKLNVANVPVTGLTITGSTQDYRSWHLLGNPFSCALTWDGSLDWNLTNIAGIAKIWNEGNQSYSDLNSSLSAVIPATNGFMVQVSTGTGSLTLPASKRELSSQAFYKSTIPWMKLTARNLTVGNAQESVVIFNPESTEGFDILYDGERLSGYGPQFYSLAGDVKLSTNSLPGLSAETVIPFTFIKNEGENFSIVASDLENIIATPFLTDLKTGITQNLSENPVFTFTAAQGDAPQRFKLHFNSVGITDNEATQEINIWSYQNKLCFNSSKAIDVQLTVYNITGQLIYGNNIELDGVKEIGLNAPAGWYIVKLVTDSGVTSKKIFLN